MPAGLAIVAPWDAADRWPSAGIHPPALLPVAGLKWAKENRPSFHQGDVCRRYQDQPGGPQEHPNNEKCEHAMSPSLVFLYAVNQYQDGESQQHQEIQHEYHPLTER